MKRTVTALALVASLSAFAAPAAFAMGEELTMLELAVDNAFTQIGIRDVNVSTLTLAELALIKSVLDSDSDNQEKKSRVEAIIRNN